MRYTVGLAHYAAGMLQLLEGDWAKARSLIERGIAVFRTGNIGIMLPDAVATSGLGPGAARRGERGAEPAPGGRAAPRAARGEGNRRPARRAYHSAGSCLSAARPARRGAAPGRPRGRILSASARVRGPCAAPARRHRDPSRPVRCGGRRGPLPPGAGARRAARHAPLIAHCHLGLGSSAGARASRTRLASISPPPRRCTVIWTCGSGWTRRRQRRGRQHHAKHAADRAHPEVHRRAD